MADMQCESLRCTFCGKGQDEVRHLITCPTAAICDECTLLAAGIVHEGAVRADDRNEYAALAAALPFVERIGREDDRAPFACCEPESARLTGWILCRMDEIRRAQPKPDAAKVDALRGENL